MIDFSSIFINNNNKNFLKLFYYDQFINLCECVHKKAYTHIYLNYKMQVTEDLKLKLD
jgi:hypothetical protein